MSDEALLKVVRRAQDEPAFRDAMLRDPDAALAEHGYDLSDEELAAVRGFHAEVSSLSSEERDARIAAAATGEGFP